MKPSILLSFLLLPGLATAESITITIANNSNSTITRVSGQGAPSSVLAGKSSSYTVASASTGSSITVKYSLNTGGGCEFHVGHKEYPNKSPVYEESATSFGGLATSRCYIYLSKKWSDPYNYKATFTVGSDGLGQVPR